METKKYQKKGFAGQSVGAIVTLIIGVGIATLVLIFVGTLGGQTYNVAEPDISSIGNTSAVADAFNVTDKLPVQLDFNNIHSGSLVVYNSTSHLVNLNNFTIDYSAGTILLKSVGSFNKSILYANYSHGAIDIQTSVKNSIISGFSSIESTGDYLPLIVLAVVITLVMALVLTLGSMGGFGNRGGSAL